MQISNSNAMPDKYRISGSYIFLIDIESMIATDIDDITNYKYIEYKLDIEIRDNLEDYIINNYSVLLSYVKNLAFKNAKESKRLEINYFCRESIIYGFKFEGELYGYDVDPDQINIAKLARIFDNDSTKVLPIRTKKVNGEDGHTELFNADRFNLFMSIVEKHQYEDNLLKAWELKDRLEKAITIEEINDVKWIAE